MSLKFNELRIGNLVNQLGFDNDAIICIDAMFETISTNSIMERPIDHFDPIKLTKEWLFRFGFKKYVGWDDMVYWCLPKDHDNINRFELFEVNKGFETPNEKICEFVHQLQNCYYFHELTGEELTIKTTTNE